MNPKAVKDWRIAFKATSPRTGSRGGYGAILLALLCVVPLFSGAAGEDEYEERVPSEERMEELREQDRFDYEQEKDGEGERSLMERFRAFLRDLFYSEGEEQLDPRRILTWIMMILALILVARFLWKNGGAYLFHRDPKAPVEERPFSALTRDRSIDPMDRVREAEAERNFIEAVRWYYISILRQLDEKGLIRQRSYRTDREYLQELRNSGYEEAFERLSRFFHLVRYGDRPLDESSYRYWAERFKELQKRIGHAS